MPTLIRKAGDCASYDVSHVLIGARRLEDPFEFLGSRNSTLEGLLCGHFDLLRRRKRARGVDDRARRRRCANAVHLDDIPCGQWIDDRMNLVRRRAADESATTG